MRKNFKLVGIMVLSGVLAVGLGCGIAFAEYSSFSYGGKKYLTGSEEFIKTVNYKVPVDKLSARPIENMEDEDTTEYPDGIESEATTDTESATEAVEMTKKPVLRYLIHSSYEIVEDKNVPKDEIQFELHYVSDDTDVKPEVYDYIEDGDYIVLETYLEYNDFRSFMRGKDIILNDIKNHTISEIEGDSVAVRVKIHPDADFELQSIRY